MPSDSAAGDCPPCHSLLITTTNNNDDEVSSDSLRALLFAVDTPTTSHSHHSTAIDLDLLLSRDSIDAYDDQHYHQQQISSLVVRTNRGRTSELIRPEVTAVQAFLDEWQHDDDDDGAADATAVRPIGTGGGGRMIPTRPSRNSSNQKEAASTITSTTNDLITPTARHAPKPKCIGTREREKEETNQLRREALQLELQLEQLRQSVQFAVKDSGEGVSAAPLWKSLSERQRERLQLAAMENKSLKIAVRDQKRMAKSLHRILLNRVMQVTVRGFVYGIGWLVWVSNISTTRCSLL